MAAFLAVSFLAPAALAQLTPDRTYYGLNRSMPMQAARPQGVQGDLSVELLIPGSGAKQTASVVEGAVDLASLFPKVWEGRTVVYAQLFAGTSPVGAPVVLQPLIDPPMPVGDGRGGVKFNPSEGTYSGIRAYVEQHVVFTTTAGEIAFRMRPDAAPNTVWNFMELVRGGFYTDILFHRIVAKTRGGHPFVIQVGDPTGTGSGGPGYYIDLENSTLPHAFGVLSMARTSDPNTNGSQVFVCLSRPGTEFLDGKYTAFGEAVSGAEVINAIGATEVAAGDRPKDEANGPRIISAKLVDAPPYGTGPAALTRPEDAAVPTGR